MRIFILCCIVAIVLGPCVAATDYHMPLLAVEESEGNMSGSLARLSLSIEPGQGRVYINTIPVTQADTQMSTRIAKRLACRFLDKGCNRQNFFYTIRSRSTIIGGPSASAATSVLTVAALEGLEVKPNRSITGTINSGNIIGSVGGVKEKIEAASKNGITMVLIPKGEGRMPDRNLTNQSNQSEDLVEYGRSLNVTVVEVTTLEEALGYLTDGDFEREEADFTVSSSYTSTMRELADQLCNRTQELVEEVKSRKGLNYSDQNNQSMRAERSYERMHFYSAASYCFGENVRLRGRLYRHRNFTDMEPLFARLRKRHDEKSARLEARNISTITDLQTYMIVEERLREAGELLESIALLRNETNASIPYGDLAYAKERLYSADSWSSFFDSEGQEYDFDREMLESSCVERLAEADELYQYVRLYVPSVMMGNVRSEYQKAHEEHDAGNYALCLFRASRLKAKTNSLLTSIGLRREETAEIVSRKLQVARNLIAEQASKGRFPIVGYSYYEYANSLREREPFSALLYAEYALELSNLDLYFEQDSSPGYYVRKDSLLLFSGGFFAGAGFVLLIVILATFYSRKKYRYGKRRKRRRV